MTIWDCRTHVRMTSSVERTDLDFKISVALVLIISECDVLPMHRKKSQQIIFATLLDFCGNLVEVM